jgi:radical SAM protein with 4Fe4S-binding SPASM domain
MVRLAADAGLTVAIYTNGTLLDTARARALVEAAPASITVSMEGGTPEEYNRLRVNARWERVASNLRGLVEARREAGRRCPLIVVRGIALDGLAEQQHAHAALYREMGADQVMWVPARNWSGSLRAPQESVRIPLPASRTQLCNFPRLVLAIDWDGTAVPCCEDFNAKNALGNVDVTSLREIWNGAALASLRQALATRDRDHIDARTGCAGCSHLSEPEAPLNYKLQLARMVLGEYRARLSDG